MMTEQEQIIAIAEACKWRREYIFGNGVDDYVWIHPTNGKAYPDMLCYLPDHLNDLNSHTTMAKTDIENTQDTDAIGVVVQCRCSACGGCTHEPAIAVHNVFSEAIPGAFGVGFLRRLLGKPND
jgi:hypothetical protein